MVSSPYPLQLTLNHAPEGSKRDRPMRRFSAMRAHTVLQTFFTSAIRLWTTLPVDICKLSPDSFNAYLSSFRFMSAPDYRYVTFKSSICSALFLSQLSVHCLLHGFLDTHPSAYSLVVRYCSESSRHRYRKMKMKTDRPILIRVQIW